MKQSELNRIFLARDVYPKWKSLIAKAQDNITIFTPFLDRLILSLLKVNPNIETSRVTIVTDFEPASILELPNQLRTIKKALTSGISVLTLSGLHAKVLVVDNWYVILGSQNFTSRARKSKEASVVPRWSFEYTRFVETLKSWRDQANPINEDLVDLLISKITRRIKQHKKLLEETQAEFDKLVEQHEQEKRLALIRRLEQLESQSRIHMAQGVVYASIQTVFGEWDEYDSLLADPEYDMTEWNVRKLDGTIEPYHLSRLSMYPMILADSLRMGFARIGKTRITYIRESLDWDTRKLEVGGLVLDVNITFPDTETKRRNIIVRLSHAYRGTCEFAILYTGDSVTLVRKRYFKGKPSNDEEHETFVSTLENEFFEDIHSLDDFFGRFFTHFTYAELGRDHKNVRDYLRGTRFRLSVIEYRDNPFLVVAKIRM